MKSFVCGLLFFVVAVSNCQETEPTVGPTTTTTKAPTTTASSGQPYGAVCNGIISKCNRYSETVLCMTRKANATVGAETCATGGGVDLGRCQCRRNCGSDGIYVLEGEFDEAQQKCVGFVGKSCQIFPNCTSNAHCNFVTRICECDAGYVSTSDGLKCTPA